MPNYPLYIPLPGMEVYLTECFFQGVADRPRRLHSHPAYELVCIEKDDGVVFQIVPPLMEHLAVDAPPEAISSLLFSFTPDGQNDICLSLKGIKTAPVSFRDDFQGSVRIRNAKQLAENILQPGARELLTAELRLLFICLARKMAGNTNTAENPCQTLDQKRLAILEDYFNIGLKDPGCSKAQLASLLGVSERQLTRILDQTYHSTFSNILLRSRMSIAHAMAAEGLKSAESIAEAVGFSGNAAVPKRLAIMKENFHKMLQFINGLDHAA